MTVDNDSMRIEDVQQSHVHRLSIDLLIKSCPTMRKFKINRSSCACQFLPVVSPMTLLSKHLILTNLWTAGIREKLLEQYRTVGPQLMFHMATLAGQASTFGYSIAKLEDNSELLDATQSFPEAFTW